MKRKKWGMGNEQINRSSSRVGFSRGKTGAVLFLATASSTRKSALQRIMLPEEKKSYTATEELACCRKEEEKKKDGFAHFTYNRREIQKGETRLLSLLPRILNLPTERSHRNACKPDILRTQNKTQ